MRFIRVLLFAVFFSFIPVHAGLILSNESPRWGETIQVDATLDFPKDTLHPGDRVFLKLDTRHQGTFNIEYAEMSWDGEKFTIEVVIPSGCEAALFYVLTPEKQLKYYKRIYPFDTDGNPPPGSVILSTSDSVTEDEWLTMVAAELKKYPEILWAYQEVWRTRIFWWHNLETDELLWQVKSLENSERTPELLKTLAMGYWYTAEFETAYARLEELCRRFPDSPYALHAINDAISQAFSNNLNDMRSSINRLAVDIIKRAPENPILRYHHNATAWLSFPGHTIETLKKVCDPWIAEEPSNPKPHYYLGQEFARIGLLQEADDELTQALTLAYQPRPWEPFIISGRGYIHQLRSEVRARQGRLVEALADSKLAQEYTSTSTTKDIETEASLLMKLGYPDKAEEIAIAAYRKGSQTVEPFLEELYEQRTKKADGFQEWLTAKLEYKSGVMPDDQALEKSPAFKGKTLQGENIDSKSFNDDLIVLNFWATTCGPCIREMPDLNRLVDQYQAKIRFLAVSGESEERINNFLQKHIFSYEIIPDAGAIEKAFRISSHPTHIVIKSGQILWKGSGASSGNTERLEGIIKRFLDGTLN